MFEEWKKIGQEHYLYYNILEKMIVGIEMNEREEETEKEYHELVEKIMAKIKNIGMELHRAIPN